MARTQMPGPRGAARMDERGQWLCLGCGERLPVERFYVCNGNPKRMCRRCDNLRNVRQRKVRAWKRALASA